jgi:hypothetical protein
MPSGELILSITAKGEDVFLSRPSKAANEVFREIRIREATGYRSLIEIVAETPFEQRLLQSYAEYQRTENEHTITHKWRMGKTRGISDKEVDTLESELRVGHED